ncbi:MAG TPA: hypothetical protein VLM05_13285 [Mycobacteriales bacterium]|nr:hypothetical protein [Mycobacteriales bacterium]
MRKRTILLALLAAAGANLLVSAPAHAVPGLSFHSASTASNTTDTKSVSVACPAGTKPLGGGFFVSGGAGGRISVTRLQALSPSNTYAVTATEADDGAPGAWALHGYATCAPALPGLTYVSFSTGSDSTPAKIAIATCPAGKRVVGTGARLLGDAGQVVLDDVHPNAGLTSVSASAYEDGSGYAGNWNLYAYATCATNPAGLVLATADTAPANSLDDAVGATCPGSTRLLSPGGSVNGGTGHVFYGGIYPSADLTQAVAVTIEQNGGYGSNWWTQVSAICAS